jgi:hypothetical protein
MGTINDEILRATGGPTLNEGLASWFTQTTAETLSDAEHRWLLAQAATTNASINDMWEQFLLAAPNSYSGSLNDMKYLYWSAQP